MELRIDGNKTNEPLLELAGIRDARGYSMRFISEQLRISRTTLVKLERASDIGRVETLEAYARAIDAKLYIAPTAKLPDRPTAHVK